MNNQYSLKNKLHNVAFYCVICEKWKNADKDTPYFISRLLGIEPYPDGNVKAAMQSSAVCENCFKKPEYNFTEQPSPIEIPTPVDLKGIKDAHPTG